MSPTSEAEYYGASHIMPGYNRDSIGVLTVWNCDDVLQK